MARKQVVYIAGKMRGVKYYNFPAFDSADLMLTEKGYEVLNPAQMDREHGFDAMRLPDDYDWNSIPEGFDFDDCVERDIQAVKDCDIIYMLDGWQISKGAKAELALAEWLGKEVMYELRKTTTIEEQAEERRFVREVLELQDEADKICGIKRMPTMRTTDTGATRNSLEGKLQYSRFLDPEVLKRFCEYMDKHRVQADGQVRDPDNWKKGLEVEDYMDCLHRHVMNLWGVWKGYERLEPETGEPESEQELLCAIMFNAMGLLFELIQEERDERAK